MYGDALPSQPIKNCLTLFLKFLAKKFLSSLYATFLPQHYSTIYSPTYKEANMRKHRTWMYLIVAIVAMMLSACGGGGGDGDDNTTASSKWDTMKWDQGQWK
jgi:hypothetical protein